MQKTLRKLGLEEFVRVIFIWAEVLVAIFGTKKTRGLIPYGRINPGPCSCNSRITVLYYKPKYRKKNSGPELLKPEWSEIGSEWRIMQYQKMEYLRKIAMNNPAAELRGIPNLI